MVKTSKWGIHKSLALDLLHMNLQHMTLISVSIERTPKTKVEDHVKVRPEGG